MSVRPRIIVGWLVDIELPRVAATASWIGVNGSKPCVAGSNPNGSGDPTQTGTPTAPINCDIKPGMPSLQAEAASAPQDFHAEVPAGVWAKSEQPAGP
jgi:hypothetical protein